MNPASSPLLTDLYQLTMLHAYFTRGMRETAVFELFVRKLPPQRNFLLAAGLEQALDFLEGLRFDEEELEWVERCGMFPREFAREQLVLPGCIVELPVATGNLHQHARDKARVALVLAIEQLHTRVEQLDHRQRPPARADLLEHQAHELARGFGARRLEARRVALARELAGLPDHRCAETDRG